MADDIISDEERRRLAKLLNERLKLTSTGFVNGGLAMIAGAIGLIWSSKNKLFFDVMILIGFVVILVGWGLLEFMRSEE